MLKFISVILLFRFALEDLFYKYGVDLEFWAHEHSYERMWPLYDYKVYNGSREEPYTNPKAPVHIVVGSAVSIVYFCSDITLVSS